MHRHEAPTGLEIAGLVGALALAVVAVASLALAELGAHDGVTALVIVVELLSLRARRRAAGLLAAGTPRSEGSR